VPVFVVQLLARQPIRIVSGKDSPATRWERLEQKKMMTSMRLKLSLPIVYYSKLSRCARRALRCSPRSPAQALRGPGSHWTAHACMEVMPCVCCKPVAEGGAGVGLHMLRGARKRSVIWVRGPGRNSSALTQPRLPDARPRGGALPLAHETRCPAGGGWGGPAWSRVLVGECRTRCRRWRGAWGSGPLVSISSGRCAVVVGAVGGGAERCAQSRSTSSG
jgi:hypothetical protein